MQRFVKGSIHESADIHPHRKNMHHPYIKYWDSNALNISCLSVDKAVGLTNSQKCCANIQERSDE